MWEVRAARVRLIIPWDLSPTSGMHTYMSHEPGHGFGLLNAPTTSNTIMNGPMPDQAITYCDTEAINRVYCPSPTPTPTPTPMPTPTPGMCNGAVDYSTYPSTGCASGFVSNGSTCTRSDSFINVCLRYSDYDRETCACTGGCDGQNCSPVVVDVLGNGFDLTDAANGVSFDLSHTGTPAQYAWTSINSDDAWLALDRDGDGLITNGRELFGSVTPQEPLNPGEQFNGFRAMALYDEPAYGGNGDGKLNASDAIFSQLRLWRDTNHNGISESCELFPLAALGISELDLNYKASNRVDQFGNQFRYLSKVRDVQGAQAGRWAWDVFLVKQ